MSALVSRVADDGDRDRGRQDGRTRHGRIRWNAASGRRRRFSTQDDRQAMVTMRRLDFGATPCMARAGSLRRMRVYEGLAPAFDATPMNVLGRREPQTDHGRSQKTRHDGSRRCWHGRDPDLTSRALPQNDSVALNRASRGFRMAVGCSHVAPLFE